MVLVCVCVRHLDLDMIKVILLQLEQWFTCNRIAEVVYEIIGPIHELIKIIGQF